MNPETHVNEAPWVKTTKNEQQNLEEINSVRISEQDKKAATSQMKNWTTPGVDGVHTYWWKSLKSTQKVLVEFLQDALNNPHVIPDYFKHGTAHMISKKDH